MASVRKEGHRVSIAQLFRWCGVARSPLYYRPPVRVERRARRRCGARPSDLEKHRRRAGRVTDDYGTRPHRLTQEYITPYTPEENGIAERLFLKLKQECAWLQRFGPCVSAGGGLARPLGQRASALLPGLSHVAGVSRAISRAICTETRGTPHPFDQLQQQLDFASCHPPPKLFLHRSSV